MSTEDLIGVFEQIPTPFYYYNLDLLQDTLTRARKVAEKYDYRIHYALKANADKRILELVRKAGMGADCVSGNEVERAVAAGFHPADVFFAGVGKTDHEIRLALEKGIGCFNVESFEELQVTEQLAREAEYVAPVAIRINPRVDAHTHRYITTGTEINKFGILEEDLDPVFALLGKSSWLDFKGIHVHIGSQITEMNVFRRMCERVNDLQNRFSEKGFAVSILDIGGGLGVDYEHPEENPVPDFELFFETIHENLNVRRGQRVHFELGRSLVAQMGDLITSILYVKKSGPRTFLVVDAGMTDLIRPALYETEHKIENLSWRRNRINKAGAKVDIVGPVCETADTFARDLDFPPSRRGDILAIRSVGAYGQMMSSHYNLRNTASVVYSDDIQVKNPTDKHKPLIAVY